MATHSSTLAWKITWMEEPRRVQSMGSLSVKHDWAISLFTFMHWRRKWQPTPVFLPGESQGPGSLVGCRLWVAQSRTQLKRLSSSSSSSSSSVFYMFITYLMHGIFNISAFYPIFTFLWYYLSNPFPCHPQIITWYRLLILQNHF